MQYSFLNDYSEGAHPLILSALKDNNEGQELGYGNDTHCEQARTILREKTQQPNAAVHFVTGGTQANLLCIAAMLKPFEAIIAPTTGHIAANEAGAIEATGHKVITLPDENGKLTPDLIEQAIKQFSLHPHMVKARAVYLSNSTEIGSVYNKAELTEIAACCRANNLYLFMDGARLGAALASKANDMSLADIAHLTDIFWLGGTKMGALFGEAIIITNNDLKIDFAFHLKQRGAMLAKGRTLGLQFLALFNDNLYLSLSRHANHMAEKLATGLVDNGHTLISPIESNQIFAMLPQTLITRLQTTFGFYEWATKENDSHIIRLVTSWATEEKQVEAFISALKTHA